MGLEAERPTGGTPTRRPASTRAIITPKSLQLDRANDRGQAMSQRRSLGQIWARIRDGPTKRAREDPVLSDLDADFDFRLVAWLARAGRKDRGAVVGGEIRVAPVEIEFVAMCSLDRGLQVVGH
jgi:hypothetical protein